MTIVPVDMTGASIVGYSEGEAVVLAVHGAFDGASAWALRLRMEELGARRIVVDLEGVEEACEFAACLLSAWSRQHAVVALEFRTSSAAHARLLVAYGLEVKSPEGPEALPEPAASLVGTAEGVTALA